MALTPIMEQYLAIKRQYPDAVVFFRLGDFYEVFFDDAPQVAALLDLTLTARDGGDGKVPMCGVPHHAVQGYIARLVKTGKKVAICEQMEDPKNAKGLVKREVTRVVTPSTFIENDADPANPLLLGLFRVQERWGLAVLEPSTGMFHFWEESDATLSEALERIAPSEIVTTKSLATSSLIAEHCEARSGVVITRFDDWQAVYDDSVVYIKAFFGLDSLRALELDIATTIAVALVLRFLQSHLQAALPHITFPRRQQAGTAMLLGSVVERSLELFRPANPDYRGKTLLDILDETLTPMGGRLLRRWVRSPLLSLPAIVERHEAVGELVEHSTLLETLRTALSPLRDVERLAARFSCQVATPKDAAALRDSLTQVPELGQALGEVRTPLLVAQREQLAADLSELCTTLRQALVDVPPLHLREGGIFARGYHAELDRLQSAASDAKQWLAALQAREISRTGISSLKVGYNRVFGYYLEVSNPHLAKVPTDYTRKQTLANAERFITPELKEYEEQILHAEERAITLEQELFSQLCALVLQHLRLIQAVASAIAHVDALACFAWVALRQQYVRPEMSEEPILQISGGRHPVVETLLGRSKFVENDVLLDRETHQLLLLTAPNMSGKSVYLRQIALIVLLAQIGSFVPAQQARIGVVDRIFTRIGASDNLALGESTFAVEMIETAQILNYATPRSLLLLDEIGRGTSTSDGLSIARAIIEFLVDPEGPRPRTLFATHFHELTDLQQLLPGVENHTFAVREWKGEVIFLYKVILGGADDSYGIHVAKLAGLPRVVIERAEEILKDLEERGVNIIRPPKRPRANKVRTALSENPAQLGLFRNS
ncbi:MAG TPA: DNA mismatch repair protein MutS [Candidatus Binatia bacterium]|nr:DNA mismatch repair protein MutS [Candidatus Binatia bacterium]